MTYYLEICFGLKSARSEPLEVVKGAHLVLHRVHLRRGGAGVGVGVGAGAGRRRGGYYV